jgi:hypothetical protein
MSLPDIDLNEIRRHYGDQANAFEELCCQLANDEPLPDRVRFDNKGRGGDAGIECFVTHTDGSETGWQVKFYSDIDSMLRSLDGSLTRALEKHPAMRRFIACFPFDLADSRRDDVTTALTKWNQWHDRRIQQAAQNGRVITIDRWDAHEIKQRLTDSNPRSAGRVAFWFDQMLLSGDWFRRALERTTDSLGNRYSPETHVDIPVRQTILAAVRDPAIFDVLETIASRIDAQLEPVPRLGNEAVHAAAASVMTGLRRLAMERPSPFPHHELARTADVAADLTTTRHGEIRLTWKGAEPSPEMVALSDLGAALRSAGRTLTEDHWKYLDARALLVLGDAGTGKSHLLADACSHQVNEGRPAIMVLGGKLPDAEPWGEILRDLDAPRHLQVRQFLGALNAAAEASGVRALIAIDALNENKGQAIWPERLGGLLNDIHAFPWITVVLSCRTTYERVVIPPTLDAQKLPRITHHGFDDNDVFRYLRRRNISVPETPRQFDELGNPLFLRLTCDALNAEGEALMPESLGGISDVLELFVTAVTRRIEATLKAPPRRKLVAKSVAALAQEMSATGRGQIRFERADELVRSIHDGSEFEHDLLFQMENEGLLAIDVGEYNNPSTEEFVRFTFERVGDHAIVMDLLDRSNPADPNALCSPGSPLGLALADIGSWIIEGLLEALAIQLPERFGMELPDLPDMPSRLWLDAPFRESLLSRRPTAFSARTWELIEETGDASLRFNTFIALATEPDHPFNVSALDAELRELAMPQRDARWSIYLAASERATHLVDWAWNVNQQRVTNARAELAAIQLTWFFTTTDRPLRDRATKALAALLTDRPGLAVGLWRQFRDVDDAYLTERVMAALYGAAMQGRWEQADLSSIAMSIYDDFFVERRPPTNVLLRDHALGLVSYAMHRGAVPDAIDPANLQGPFISDWPIGYVSDETIETYVRQSGDGGTWRDEIVGSCQDGDFGRYVLDYAVQDWSPALIGTSPLPTSADLRNAWYEAFEASATPDMLTAYKHLATTLEQENPRGTSVYGEKLDRIRTAKMAFREAVGSDVFEQWQAEAEPWRTEGMYQILARQGPAEFNLAWARRWVVKRAHDLGWSADLHGEFDSRVRTDRHTHTVERIGKKYQWLALYELVARMRDNLERLPDREDDPLQLRNLDPSLLLEQTADDGWRAFGETAFWIGTAPGLPARTSVEALAWLDSSDDILDGIENIAVKSPDEARHWLVLTGFENWRRSSSGVRCDAWRRVACLVVRAKDRDITLDILAATQMLDHGAVPTAQGGGYHVHLGEFPWRSAGDNQDDWISGWRPFSSSAGPGVAIRPTTAEYSAESNGYDGSIKANINLHMPARWLMNGLDLRLTNGRSVVYKDRQGITRFMDPSVSMEGRSAALIDRGMFLDFLQREGLVAIWTIAGEKNAYGDRERNGFGGRFAFTRVFYSDGHTLRIRGRHAQFDRPSEQQLATFLRGPSDGDEQDERE